MTTSPSSERKPLYSETSDTPLQMVVDDSIGAAGFATYIAKYALIDNTITTAMLPTLLAQQPEWKDATMAAKEVAAMNPKKPWTLRNAEEKVKALADRTRELKCTPGNQVNMKRFLCVALGIIVRAKEKDAKEGKNTRQNTFKDFIAALISLVKKNFPDTPFLAGVAKHFPDDFPVQNKISLEDFNNQLKEFNNHIQYGNVPPYNEQISACFGIPREEWIKRKNAFDKAVGSTEPLVMKFLTGEIRAGASIVRSGLAKMWHRLPYKSEVYDKFKMKYEIEINSMPAMWAELYNELTKLKDALRECKDSKAESILLFCDSCDFSNPREAAQKIIDQLKKEYAPLEEKRVSGSQAALKDILGRAITSIENCALSRRDEPELIEHKEPTTDRRPTH